MKIYVTIIMILAMATTVLGASIKTEVKVEAAKVKAETAPGAKAGQDPFRDGELYYNAMPSTPAQGTAVKVIETDDDTDYICKVYKLKTPGIVYEIKELLRPTIDKENGKILSICNAETLEQYLIVTAPKFQFSYFEDAIFSLDQKGTRAVKSGSKYLVYECKHRLASELRGLLEGTLLSGYGNLVIDDTVNKIVLKDSPSWSDHAAKYLPMFDVPPKMVRVEAQIIEIEMDDDFNFGLALEAWKEALPENVDMTIDWSQSKSNPGGGPAGWARYVAQNVQLSGMRPKAVANFINYLVRNGKAEVLSSPTVVAMNGKEAIISSIDNINYKAYSQTSEPLDKQAQTGVSLTIIPTIASKTLSLDIEAEVNSVVGWSSGGTPIVNTRSTSADVVLKSGELFTLSGLKKETVTQVDEGIPLLMDIPLLGMLFKHQIDVKKTSEIVVLLTPHKVTPETGVTKREKELLKEVKDNVEKERSGIEKFVDRVIYK